MASPISDRQESEQERSDQMSLNKKFGDMTNAFFAQGRPRGPGSLGRWVAIWLLAAFTMSAAGQTITVYPGPSNIEAGSSRQLSAYVPLSPSSIHWTINDLPGGNAIYGTISPSGLYQAPATAPAANVITIKAISTAYPGVVGAARLTITRKFPWVWGATPSSVQAGANEIILNGSNFTPDSEVLVDGVRVQASYVSSTRLVAKPVLDQVGTRTIAVRQPGPGLVVGNGVRLQVLAPTVSVAVSPGTTTLMLGGSQSFKATVGGASNTSVIWSVDGVPGGSSGVGTIDSAGVYTAPLAMTTSGGATIRATSAALPSAYAQALVTLLPPPAIVVVVSPGSGEVQLGKTLAFSATVTGASTSSVVWSINGIPGGSAALGQIDGSGLYTSPLVMPPTSNLVVRATSTANTNRHAEAMLTLHPPPPVVHAALHCARFLEQSSFGPTPATLDRVGKLGVAAYLEEQFSLPTSEIPSPPNLSNSSLRQWILHHYTTAPDQLRQRVAYSLSQILVCSAGKLTRADELLPWMRALNHHAFGNYKDLLREVTKSPSMGKYLDLANSQKPGAAGGANENFARELMQLFTIGLWDLNMDGTTATNEFGQPRPSYDQGDIAQLALALTGWTYATAPGAVPQATNWENFDAPMEPRQQNHATTGKAILGFHIPPGQTVEQDLESVLEGLMTHPNTAPFIATRLIRSLVTSNPSRGYVQRVAEAFADNGAGVRGDLKAVVKAILLDYEARNDLPTPDQGRLKEPILHVCGFLRALNGRFNAGHQLAYVFDSMAQSVLNPPSVFSWFSPMYRLQDRPLFGPEFQIYSPTEATLRGNMFHHLLSGSGGDFTIDLSPFQAYGQDMPALVEKANQVLLHGRMPAAMKQILIDAAAPGYDAKTRIQTVLYLTALSGHYAVQY